MIVVIDYALGNVGSVLNMVRKAGGEAVLSGDPERILAAEKLILPGVGAFDCGMDQLARRGLIDVLKEKVLGRGTPLLGICLGMQLLCRGSEEGERPGLGWIDARAVRFRPGEDGDRLKVPHMGWNSIVPARGHPLFPDPAAQHRFYFVHSYHVRCGDPGDILARARHGIDFVAALARGPVVGLQFHPEKSHRFGLAVLRHFVAWQPQAPAVAVPDAAGRECREAAP